MRTVVFKMLERMLSVLRWFYLKSNPISAEIKEKAKELLYDPDKRIKELNIIRFKNIITTIYYNTGALFGIFITVLSLFFAFFLAFVPIFKTWPWEQRLLIVVIILILAFLVSFLCITAVFRKMVEHLSPEEYADITISDLGESEILTIVSLKMYELCELFTSTVVIDAKLKKLQKDINVTSKEVFAGTSENDETELRYEKELDENLYINHELKPVIEKLYESVKTFIGRYYPLYYNTLALQNLATSRLKIQEREFSHHILKFSPAIFNSRVHTLQLSVDTLLYVITNPNDYDERSFKTLFNKHLGEINAIRDDIEENVKRSLLQLILFNDIHKYLVGVSSLVSTSRSLKIFLRGLSRTISKLDRRYGKAETEKVKVQVKNEFESILHRSKAHYGMDLLISLENFYKVKEPVFTGRGAGHKTAIPELLFRLKYPKRISEIAQVKIQNPPDQNVPDYFYKLVNPHKNDLKSLRRDMLDFSENDMDQMVVKFKRELLKRLEDLEDPNSKIHLCLFGYSRVVRDVLKKCIPRLEKELLQKIEIFIFKDRRHKMIDTRIFRYELNDEKPHYNIRNTFTGSDDLLFSFVSAKDQFIFIAGAEAYCDERKTLFHTNPYQERIESFIQRLLRHTAKPDPEVWVIANDYKVFKGSFPPNGSFLFRHEFTSDHYDFVDLYNFKDLEIEVNRSGKKVSKGVKVRLISNDI
ncbi:hypothetical protein [Ascidiimonas aurantiaca]|uniref:hypothetical protein n=1 Tax=Ascidiimonas aurantiaca TaxID=1685432 RepID=UPI0030EB4674